MLQTNIMIFIKFQWVRWVGHFNRIPGPNALLKESFYQNQWESILKGKPKILLIDSIDRDFNIIRSTVGEMSLKNMVRWNKLIKKTRNCVIVPEMKINVFRSTQTENLRRKSHNCIYISIQFLPIEQAIFIHSLQKPLILSIE